VRTLCQTAPGGAPGSAHARDLRKAGEAGRTAGKRFATIKVAHYPSVPP
jgi:hypothetical protein